MRLVGLGLAVLVVSASPLAAQNAAVTVNVDATTNRHAIDPRVYGVNWATGAQLSDLNVPLNRAGGNTTTRYNWSLNASNHANDWYYESIADARITHVKLLHDSRHPSRLVLPLAAPKPEAP